MVRVRRLWSGPLAAALLAPAACFYTGTINERPRAEIDILTRAPAYYPDDDIEFGAHKSGDPDGEQLAACRWTAVRCRTDSDCDAPFDERTGSCTDIFAVHLPTGPELPDSRRAHDRLVVRLQVEDEGGAQSLDAETIYVGNRPPEVDIEVPPTLADHYVVRIPIEIDAQAIDPDKDDVIALDWRLMRPRGAGDVSLVKLADAVYQLTPDVSGVWTVQVTASDDFGEMITVEQPIPVMDDQPPCIQLTLPAPDEDGRFVLRRDEGPRAFSVLRVKDDLDPYPRPPDDSEYLGEARFAWQLASPDTGGALVPIAGADGPELVIDPSAYAPGDQVDLRVEVADRVARDLPCDEAEPTCALGGGECLQRLTWGVEVR